MLGNAVGLLGWTPRTFWQSTPHEYHAAREAREAAYSDDGGKA